MRLKLRDKPLAVLDMETTGLDPEIHEVIEVALYIPSRDFTYAQKIKPEHIETAQPEALAVNGYTPELWVDALPAREVFEVVNGLLQDCVPLGQNISFDLGFYNATCKRLDIKPSLDYRHVELYTLAYIHLVPHGLNSMSLVNVCKFLGITNEGAHAALADVERTWAVYKRLRAPSWLDRLRWAWAGRKAR